MQGFKIIKATEVLTDLKQHRDTYKDTGKYLGWDKMHKHYSMSLGNCTDWTGLPRSGKTELLESLLLNTSIWYGWRHLIYFPDSGDAVEVLADLLHKKTGKTFDPTKPHVISDADIVKELEWITYHFKILVKEDDKATMSPIQFWEYAIKLKNAEGLETASIDSWKDMNHPYVEYGGYATYLEAVLPERNRLAKKNDLHFHVIVHPKPTEKEKGKRKPPTPYDIKGGSEWFNSGKCMVTVHREDMSDNRVDVYFNKIKPRAIGYPGHVELRLDKTTLNYYDMEIHPDDPNTFLNNYAAPAGTENTIMTGSMAKNKFGTEEIEFAQSDDDDLPF